MRKLSKIEAPALAGVVKESTVRAAVAQIKNCLLDGATMIDLHLSCLEESSDEDLAKIISSTSLPILALNYGGNIKGVPRGYTEEERVETMLSAVRAGAAGIDMQGYTFDLASKSAFVGEDKYSFTKNSPYEVVTDETVIAKQCELIDKVHSMGAEVLLSCHPHIAMSSDQVVELALFLEKRKPDIIKIVTCASNERDLDEAQIAMIKLRRELKTPVAYHANGKAGIPSRIINPLLGGQIAFCVDGYNATSDIEQVDLKSMSDIVTKYRKLI